MAATITDQPDALLTTEEACDAIGCTYRQLHYWASTGLLVPERMTWGSGTRRRYSAEDVLVGRVVLALTTAGAKGDPLQAAAGEVREHIGAGRCDDALWITPEGAVCPVLERPFGAIAGWVVDLTALT